MGKDSHQKRSPSEAPRASSSSSHHRSTDRPRASGRRESATSQGRVSYTPSRLSHVTNAADLTDMDAQAEALGKLSFEPPPPQQSRELQQLQQAGPATFNDINAWVEQGGQLELLSDEQQGVLLDEYLGPKLERSNSRDYHPPEEVPPHAPPAPILEAEEIEDGGVFLNEPPSYSSRHRDKGKGRA